MIFYYKNELVKESLISYIEVISFIYIYINMYVEGEICCIWKLKSKCIENFILIYDLGCIVFFMKVKSNFRE